VFPAGTVFIRDANSEAPISVSGGAWDSASGSSTDCSMRVTLQSQEKCLPVERIFEDIQRTERRPRRYSQSSFEFYSTSARPGMAAIRDLIERWYGQFPRDGKADIRGRFRSGDETGFQSAFFELYLCELCRGLGFIVEIYPGMEQHRRTSHPDFRLSLGGKPVFYIEATLAQPSRTEIAANRRLAQLQDEIDRVCCPDFWLWLDTSGTATENIPVARVRDRLDKWLATLNVDQIASTAKAQSDTELPVFSESCGSLTFTITAHPKSPDQRSSEARRLGVISPDLLSECNAHEDIRQAVIRKAKCYGDMDLPYIIAINVINSELLEFDDMLDGLFGRIEVTTWQQPRGIWHHTTRRAPNGAWTSSTGPRNPGVSGVLIADNLTPTTIGVETPVLIHNPCGRKPLPKDIWPLPQRSIDTLGKRILTHPGRQARDVLGLPVRWPLPD